MSEVSVDFQPFEFLREQREREFVSIVSVDFYPLENSEGGSCVTSDCDLLREGIVSLILQVIDEIQLNS